MSNQIYMPSAVRSEDYGNHPTILVGADATANFSAQMTGAFSLALSDPGVQAEMSSGAKLAINLATASIGAFEKEGAAGVEHAIKSVALGLALELATQALNTALQAAGAASATPILGTLASFAVMIAQALDSTSSNSAHGTGWRADEQRAFCKTDVNHGGWIEPVVPTSATGPVPADFFVNGINANPFKDGSPNYRYTTMGRLLVFATETVGEHGVAKQYGVVTLTRARREVYRKLRMAICACRENGPPGSPPTHPTGAGGVIPFLLYVDMLRADVELGRLPAPYVQYLSILEGAAVFDKPINEEYFYAGYSRDSWGGIARDVARILYKDREWSDGHGIGAAREYAEEQIAKTGWFAPCILWQNADDHPMYGLVRDWQLRLHPFYSQFPSMEQQAKEALEKLLAENGKKPRIALGPMNFGKIDRSLIPRVLIRRRTPWFKIGAALALASVGWYFW